MANAKKAEAVKSEIENRDTITVSISDAERIYELFMHIESADAHYHTCQSANFRQHVQSVYKAPNIGKAFDALKTAIDNAKGA